MKFSDQSCCVFWLAISVLVCVESSKVSVGTLHSPSAGFFPFWSGVALGVFSIATMMNSILKKKVDEKAADLWRGMDWHKVILVVIFLFIYAIFLPKLGYLIATFGLMTLLFGIMKRPRLWIQVVSALITVLATYFIFDVWLKVLLPKGIFGF